METRSAIFEKQMMHYGLLLLLLFCIFFTTPFGILLYGTFWGLSTKLWLLLAISLAVLHQVYVWFCWRTQLYKSFLTRTLGENAFTYYAAGFSILALARLFSILGVALSNKGTVMLSQSILYTIAIVISVPTVYLFYSVWKYFSFKRAFGIDHFDLSYKDKPFVDGGIFKFTKNGMYTFGLLIVGLPGLIFASKAALLLALFNHLYVWVHYITVEKPDIKRIYMSGGTNEHENREESYRERDAVNNHEGENNYNHDNNNGEHNGDEHNNDSNQDNQNG